MQRILWQQETRMKKKLEAEKVVNVWKKRDGRGKTRRTIIVARERQRARTTCKKVICPSGFPSH
jgi:hypothetical protein